MNGLMVAALFDIRCKSKVQDIKETVSPPYTVSVTVHTPFKVSIFDCEHGSMVIGVGGQIAHV